jgi:hypothetical protein
MCSWQAKDEIKLYLYPRLPPTRQNLIDGMISNEAQVLASGLHSAGFGLEFVAREMKV